MNSKKIRSKISTMTLALAALLAGAMGGCATQHFGGRLCTVTLDANEKGEAFLISEKTFAREPDIATDAKRLREKGCAKGPTPITVRIEGREWYYVVCKKDGTFTAPLEFNALERNGETVKYDDISN